MSCHQHGGQVLSWLAARYSCAAKDMQDTDQLAVLLPHRKVKIAHNIMLYSFGHQMSMGFLLTRLCPPTSSTSVTRNNSCLLAT